MQHAVAISGAENEDEAHPEPDSIASGSNKSQHFKLAASYAWTGVKNLFHLLRPAAIKNAYENIRQMTFKDMITNLFLLMIKCIQLIIIAMICVFKYVLFYYCMNSESL